MKTFISGNMNAAVLRNVDETIRIMGDWLSSARPATTKICRGASSGVQECVVFKRFSCTNIGAVSICTCSFFKQALSPYLVTVEWIKVVNKHNQPANPPTNPYTKQLISNYIIY